MNLHTRISTAVQSGKLRAGGLFVVDVSDGTEFECEHQRFYLTSDLDHAGFERLSLRAGSAVVSSEILGVADDWCAWVVSYEACGLMNRAVVPLIGEEVARLIECAAQGEVFLVFTSSESDDLAVDTQLLVSDSDLALLRAHWRPHLPQASPDRLLQTLDILISAGPGSDKQVQSVALVLPADLQVSLSRPMPEFTFD